jgi:hypothetical protein
MNLCLEDENDKNFVIIINNFMKSVNTFCLDKEFGFLCCTTIELQFTILDMYIFLNL